MTRPKPVTVTLNRREQVHLIAALRFFQLQRGGFSHPEWNEELRRVRLMSNADIDTLILRLDHARTIEPK